MAKTVNTRFKKAVQNNEPFYAYAIIEFDDVNAPTPTITLDSSDNFQISGNSYSHKSSSGFPIGQAICKTISLSIDNSEEQYKEYDFNGCTIQLYTEIDTGELDENDNPIVTRVLEGKFVVVDPVHYGSTITMTAYDLMYRLDVKYPENPPSTCPRQGDTMEDAWLKLGQYFMGINGDISWIPNSNRSIRLTKLPDGITARDLAGYIAGFMGANAIVSSEQATLGKLTGRIWNFDRADDSKERQAIVSGGLFEDSVVDVYTGSSFTQSANKINAGAFNDELEIKVLNKFTAAPTITKDDVVITGVRVFYTDPQTEQETSHLYGSEGYVIEVQNKLGNSFAMAHEIGDLIIGKPFRPFSGTFAADPTVEFMDLVYIVDPKNRVYPSFITGLGFNYLGASTFENTSPTPQKHNQTGSTTASTALGEVEAVYKQNSPYQIAIEALLGSTIGAGGLYKTVEVQSDGSYIYYFHDDPDLQQSTNIVKITRASITISNDGGTTYTAGVTINGDAVLQSLAAKKVSADYIQGGTLTLGGYDSTTGTSDWLGTLSVLDTNNAEVLTIDSTGVTAVDPVTSGNQTHLTPNGITIETANTTIQISNDNNKLRLGNPGNNLTVKIEDTLETYTLKFSTIYSGSSTHNPATYSGTIELPTSVNSSGQVTGTHTVYVRNGIICLD